MIDARILVFHPALAPYRVDMFNALARRCTLRLVFLSANVPNQAYDQQRLRGLLEVEPHYLLSGITLPGGRTTRTLRLGFDDEIRRFRPDVVVTSEFGMATLSAIASRKLRGRSFALVVGTEDNPSSVGADTWLHGIGRSLLLPHADGVLTYSEEARGMYRQRFRATQPVGASPLVQSEQVILERLGRAGSEARKHAETLRLLGRRVILYVGRLAPEKRVDRLIDCVARIRPSVPDAVLALVGDGPERQRLMERAGRATSDGTVVFAGHQEAAALAAWYRLGSVFGLASEHEPFGAVVNEALIAGMPVVCSDRAGARVLVAAGKNGAVVDASRPEALDAAMIDWLRREPPLSSRQLETQRRSRMETSFDDAVTAYLDALEAARTYRSSR